MADFSKSIRTLYLKDLHGQKLSHGEKVLLIIAQLTSGVVGESVQVRLLGKSWPKSAFGVAYHGAYVVDALDEGWLSRPKTGQLTLTQKGLDHIASRFDDQQANPIADSFELFVFSPKQTHAFDKMLRQILSSAKSYVKIADSYVDDTIFDTILDEIDPSLPVSLMYGTDTSVSGALKPRANRFRIQYPKFNFARYPKLHDRYLLVDGIGFMVGPSLKDAAVNSPATVVRISSNQSVKLVTQFDNIYKNLTKIV